MDKVELRNKLFEKYFEVEDGVLITDLISSMSEVSNKWKILHEMFVNNVEYFDEYDDIEMIKDISYIDNNYLVIKLHLWQYIIIDLSKQSTIDDKDLGNIFTEDFFISNFSEGKVDNGINFFNMYSVLDYSGNIQELINFYFINKEVFNMPTDIHYKIKIGDAVTYLSIDFANRTTQLGFGAPNQFLYEQIFFKDNLVPSKMQDATSKIGKQKMNEIFDRVKLIKIPKELIPKKIYLNYLRTSDQNKGKILINMKDNI